MNSLFIIIVSIAAFSWAYKVYARKLERIFQVNPLDAVPSKTKYDGVDYVPAKNWLVLFGHHFASIAGAGPIVGPVIACCIWGWGPALILVIFGSIFLGAVHDFGALVISVKEGGKSISSVALTVISKRAYIMFALFVWLTLILVIAVFVYLCADTFVKEPRIVLPSIGIIPLAILVGFLLYNLKVNQVLATLIGILGLVVLIILGQFFLITAVSFSGWVIILLIYCFLASILPVNILLQPRDYLCSFLLIFGLVVGLLGLFISHPVIQSPAFISFNSSEGNLWPMLFVIIACGAISGFHSLISSGTTSKQIANERDARKIGYGAMIIEAVVAVMAILVVAGGLGKACLVDKSGPVVIFSKGYNVVTKNILFGYGGVFAILLLNAFILTSLDTATRITRYLMEELFKIKHRYISAFMAVALGGWLALAKDSLNEPMWKRLWPAFGASNQLVAALALFVISCWLLSRNKSAKVTLYPAIFMLVTTVAALVYQVVTNFKNGHYSLFAISLILIVLAFIMTIDVIKVFKKKRISSK
ncbi:MAG: carbon starvation protein A [Candidatus Omnitrophica bacterium]|nr:carbon starvation protein A [Candidatus Omnitrophota bacterium]